MGGEGGANIWVEKGERKGGRKRRFVVNRLTRVSLFSKHGNFVLIFALQHGCLGHGTVNIQPTPYKRHATQGKKGA